MLFSTPHFVMLSDLRAALTKFPINPRDFLSKQPPIFDQFETLSLELGINPYLKNIYHILICLTLASSIQAQKPVDVDQDSIKYAIKIGGNGKHKTAVDILNRVVLNTTDDSIKTIAYVYRGLYQRNIDFDNGILSNDSAIYWARKTFNTDVLSKVFEVRGDIYHYNSPPYRNLDSARKYYARAGEYGKDFNDDLQYAISNLKLSKTYKFAGEDAEKGINFAKKAIVLAEEKNLALELIDAYLELAGFYMRKGELFMARQILLQAINYTTKKEPIQTNKYYLCKINNELALNYLLEEDYTAALERINLMNSQESGSSFIVADSYHIRARIALGLGKLVDATRYINKSSELFRLVGSKYFQNRNNIVTSQILLKQGEYRKALEKITTIMDQANNSESINDLVQTLITRGEIYYEMKDYTSAKIDLEKASRYMPQVVNIYTERKLCYDLGQTYSKLRKMEKSNKNLLQYVKLNDKILEERQSRKLDELESNYELQMRDYKIRDLERNNVIKDLKINRNRAVIISIVGLSIMITFLSILFIRQNRLRSERQVLEMEHELLRSQMNPHFISNSLGAIQSYIYESDKSEAVSYISKFAKLMRLTIEGSRENLISLDKEIKILEYYLALQKLRLEDRLEYTFDISSEFSFEEIGVPPMLLQPFVENAVEHGIMNKENGGWIKITFSQEENYINVKIEDNGIGRAEAKKINRKRAGKHVSYATKITAERLSILNSNKLDKIGFEIIDKSAKEHNELGTIVYLKIPIA
jgi:tetratricopeptide (TPR) repeat protein